MSRSLVGSSSSSTLGSSISSRSSCSRRRSPPDRSATGSTARSPGSRTARSSWAVAVARPCRGRPPAHLLDRLDDPQGARSSSSTSWESSAGARCPASDSPPRSGGRSPGEQPQQGRLARAVDADDADPVAGAEPPGHVRRADRAPPTLEVASSRSYDVLAEPRAGEAHAARRRRAAAARRRSARWRRRSGTAAWTCGPAGRGAARPAPCAPGSAGARRSRRPAARARRGEHVRRVAALVGVDRAAGDLPGGCRPRRGTTGRG